MSRMEAWEPGGRRAMSKATVAKVPQVHGKSLLSMWELMELTLGNGLWGCEKLCTALNLPSFEVLGTSNSGDVWKGPRSISSWLRVNGPMYRPVANSFSVMVLCTFEREAMEGWLGGV